MTADRAEAAPARVTTFELFFDLVFVLTITRLAGVLHHEADLIGVLTTLLILANIWWMYSGYGWLTSHLQTSSLPKRLLLFVAMGGFLVMAIAAPNAFGADGTLFALAYLVVTVVHLGMFGSVYGRAAGREMLQIAPYNLGSAALLLIAGVVEGPADWWLWGAAAALHVVLLEVGRYRRFSLPQAHFVERNGVVLIVALGESMVALGLGLGDHAVDAQTLFAALLSLALAAALWSLYFIDADAAAERALEAAPPESVLRISGRAFAYAFVPLLAGIVLVSTGLGEVLEHPTMPVSAAGAAFLSGGAIAYLLGIAAFRQSVAAASPAIWAASVVTAVLCVGGYWLGTAVNGLVEVGFLTIALFGLVILTQRMRRTTTSTVAAAAQPR